jgi:hypothetical protein
MFAFISAVTEPTRYNNNFVILKCIIYGRAMAQVVSRRPLTAEDRVRGRVNPSGICSGQSGTGTGFSPSSSVFPCQYHSTVALQTHIIWGMRNMITQVGIHAWVLDPPQLQGKMHYMNVFIHACGENIYRFNCRSDIWMHRASTLRYLVHTPLFHRYFGGSGKPTVGFVDAMLWVSKEVTTDKIPGCVPHYLLKTSNVSVRWTAVSMDTFCDRKRRKSVQ